VRFLSVNHSAVLVELNDMAQTLALLHSMHCMPIAGVHEVVPAARTLLVRFDPHRISLPCLKKHMARRDLADFSDVQTRGALIEIPVVYDGEDLAAVAHILALDVHEVVDRHTRQEWFVAFTGFAPGFAYLVGGDPVFDVARRQTPRVKVPAGAVALAGRFSAVYPRESPGGWQLIGTTQLSMWDLSRAKPALLQAGYRVRFVDAGRQHRRAPVAAHTQVPDPPRPLGRSTYSEHPLASQTALHVKNPGIFTTFQDMGRPGLADQGISASGAMDHAALRAANRLVGNASHYAVLETTGAGLALQSQGDTVIAITGADAAILLTTRAGRQWRAPCYQAIALAHGDCVRIHRLTTGLRGYLAVRGGFAVHAVLGSASTDTLSQIGPPPLTAGQRLTVRPMARNTAVAVFEAPPERLPTPADDIVLDVLPGPRADWFTPSALALLVRQCWQVTLQSNRVGLRLHGALPLARAVEAELPSEGLVCGAIQVPISGQPVLFLRDHPVTGGYPVVACVAAHHLDRAGQIPAGAYIRFKPVRPLR